MTHAQAALVRYWLLGSATLLLLGSLAIWMDDWGRFRWVLFSTLFVAVFADRWLRPKRPPHAPTPLEIIQVSRGWMVFLAAYAFGAVALAIASTTVGEIGSWLSHRAWLLGPLIVAPMLLPVVQSEIALYRALAPDETP
jgi:hypothetical protein